MISREEGAAAGASASPSVDAPPPSQRPRDQALRITLDRADFERWRAMPAWPSAEIEPQPEVEPEVEPGEGPEGRYRPGRATTPIMPPFAGVAAAVLSRPRSQAELRLDGPLVRLTARVAVADDLAAALVRVGLIPGGVGGPGGVEDPRALPVEGLTGACREEDLSWVQVALLPAFGAGGELLRWLPTLGPGEVIADGSELLVRGKAARPACPQPIHPRPAHPAPNWVVLAHWKAAGGAWCSEPAGQADHDHLLGELTGLLSGGGQAGG